MKNAVIIGCNNKYVPKAIIALTQFTEYNIDYEKFIIGTTFTETMKLLCKKYNVGVIEVNLYADFINLFRRLKYFLTLTRNKVKKQVNQL